MGEISNRFVTIRNEIEEAPTEQDFQVVTTKISTKVDPGSNVVVVKGLLVAIDPYQLTRMKKCCSSQKTVNVASNIVPGEPIDGYGVGRVVSSGYPEFQEGDLVAGHLNWAEYTTMEHGKSLKKLDPLGFPLSYHVGTLGPSGLTAYGGFFKVCRPKKGERVFISTASGSVGNVVGQFAKLCGCYVVGCAGSSEKVALLKEKLGFDDAFNYKEQSDLYSTLSRYFPEGIDIYFDHVGGEMLEAAVANMNFFGRVAACGAIPQYTKPERSAAALDMVDIIYNRISIRGFLAYDYLDDFEDFRTMTVNYLRKGDMQVLEDISHGLESIPSAFVNLFCGRNIGKTVVKIADD